MINYAETIPICKKCKSFKHQTKALFRIKKGTWKPKYYCSICEPEKYKKTLKYLIESEQREKESHQKFWRCNI